MVVAAAAASPLDRGSRLGRVVYKAGNQAGEQERSCCYSVSLDQYSPCRRVMSERTNERAPQLHIESAERKVFHFLRHAHTCGRIRRRISTGAGFKHTYMDVRCVFACNTMRRLNSYPFRLSFLFNYFSRWTVAGRVREPPGLMVGRQILSWCQWLLAESISLSGRAAFSIKDSCTQAHTHTRACPSQDSFFGFFHLDLMHWS